MKRLSYLSASDLARIASVLSDRDREIVTIVEKLRLVTMQQVQRLFFINGSPVSNARRAQLTLKRLTDLRVLHRLDRRVGGVRAGSASHTYSLDAAGLYVAGLATQDGRRRRPNEPGLPFVRHVLAVSELGVALREAERAGKITLLDFEAEPTCWRSFFGPGGARMRLKPDAFVRIARPGIENEEHLFFVEVDLASESTTALATKFRTYRQYWSSGREQARWDDTFPKVVWLVPSIPRLRRLIDVAQAQPAESWQLFQVRLYDDALAVFAPEEAA